MGLVSTWMGDRLRAGKPSRYVANQLGQLSLPSLGVGKSSDRTSVGYRTGWVPLLSSPSFS